MTARAAAFRPDPEAGRIYFASRTVRTTDVTATARLRLDGIARYLQEAAEDDVLDAGWDEAQDWLLRSCAVTLRGYPALGDRVRLRTFCSAGRYRRGSYTRVRTRRFRGGHWPLRASDFDPAGHVNNTIAWAACRGCAVGPRLAAGPG